MKYACKQGCQILQREWINNKCGEGTAGRGGAVFNCPSAWRISQSLWASGRKQTNVQTYFHQCCFCIFPLVIPFPLLPSHAYLVFLLHFPSAFHILIDYSLSPPLPCWVFGRIRGEACLCWCVCMNVQLSCALCCIYMLRLTPRVQRLVTKDLVRSQSFCQGSLLLRNTSPYLLSRSEEARTEWDKA